MDNTFRNDSYIVTYIDDILVFRKSLKEHIKHLLILSEKCQETRLVLSEKKMKIGSRKVKSLGVIIEQGQIELQKHISTSILGMPDK